MEYNSKFLNAAENIQNQSGNHTLSILNAWKKIPLGNQKTG